FEILFMLKNTLEPICPGGVTIHFNHRGLFNKFLERLEIADRAVDILRTVDKLAKIGRDETLELLTGLAGSKAINILDYIEAAGTFEEKFRLMTAAADPEGGCRESDDLARIYKFMKETGTENSFVLDPSITRGLDYYTGIVFETFLNKMPEIGSVGSGGRYDHLVDLYTKTNSGEPSGGVGASIGIDRLIAALEALGELKTKATYSIAAIACIPEADPGICQALALKLRGQGIPCEVFLDEIKLTRQYMLAEKKGIRWLIIPVENNDMLTIRDLTKRADLEIRTDELALFLKNQQ
ncbi:MAG: ATP phosphoribosyltransferase regulatory subunit, partial [Treponema sp.]|nr:ATP phosphoribosyltransferase regulatory subunit [Treponema sp.]